ncbi:hypothetical protein ANTQUA_LOCUS6475 [Anthophora quadrimaculata]
MENYEEKVSQNRSYQLKLNVSFPFDFILSYKNCIVLLSILFFAIMSKSFFIRSSESYYRNRIFAMYFA